VSAGLGSKIDLARLETTDVSCFAFPREPRLTRTKLAELFSLGGPTVSSVPTEVNENFESQLGYSQFLRMISKFLGSERSTGAVVEARNERALKNFGSYVGSLFKDVNIKGLWLDDGLFSIPIDELKEYVPCDLDRIARIEPVIGKLLQTSGSFDELVSAFDKQLFDLVANKKVIAFKSAIAYRNGLKVDPSDEELAGEEFRAMKAGHVETSWFGPVVPKVRNALLVRAIRKAGELGVFFEIYTGLGDTDVVGTKCNPILLQELFKDKRVRGTKIVLIHSGYPFTVEASWLSRVFPNVFVEISAPFPPGFALPMGKERFMTILLTAPPSRIVYGSDCFALPEMYWMSARLAKAGLAEALEELVNREMMDEDECYSSAELIFSRNAERLIKKS